MEKQVLEKKPCAKFKPNPFRGSLCAQCQFPLNQHSTDAVQSKPSTATSAKRKPVKTASIVSHGTVDIEAIAPVQPVGNTSVDERIARIWDTLDRQVDERPKAAARSYPDRKGWVTVRVFVSSTFLDMHTERETLVRQVFPRLRAWAAPLKIHIVECELRWGLPPGSTMEKILNTCLQEVDRCKSENENCFLIAMLSERNGWIVPEKEVPVELKRMPYEWIPDFSLTQMEIVHASYRDANPNAGFFIRNPSFLENIPDSMMDKFRDTNELPKKSLAQFKSRIRRRFQGQVFDYECTAFAEQDNVTLLGLDSPNGFGDQVYEFLKSKIEAQYGSLHLREERVSQLASPHEDFSEYILRGIENGREVIIQKKLLSTGEHNNHVLVTGPSSTGKSWLLSATDKVARQQPNKFRVFFHSFQAGGSSANVNEALTRILLELGDDKAQEIDEAKLKDLVESLLTRLAQDPKKTTLLIIDALNFANLSNENGQQDMKPLELFPFHIHGPGLKIILSGTSDSVPVKWMLANHDNNLQEYELPGLSVAGRSVLIEHMLSKYGKGLDEDQTSLLISSPGSENIAWLILACEELRVFGSFERLTDKIKNLDPTMEGLLGQILDRVQEEDQLGLLMHTLALLSETAHGLSESELKIMLGIWLQKQSGISNPENEENDVPTLPPLHWSETWTRVRPLTHWRRGVNGEAVIFCYSEAIKSKVQEKLESHTNKKELRSSIVTCMLKHSHPSRQSLELPKIILWLRDKKAMSQLRKSEAWQTVSFFDRRGLSSSMACGQHVHFFSSREETFERYCYSCSMRQNPASWYHRSYKDSCGICGDFVSSNNALFHVRDKKDIRLFGMEKLAVKCTYHSHGHNMGSFFQCFVCGHTNSTMMMWVPVIVCNTCSFSFSNQCCHMDF
eukprot:m.70069 g.70069  ORF g.70069 m.70069 type:complete len:904 (-) comp12107_c0_seq1:53-2764(-)